ncbi:MAG: hypothetical protein E7260_11570 [Lachnospiraceae bacterium]|nr:hypothetical protein [Lachnospiraceae bacterium]
MASISSCVDITASAGAVNRIFNHLLSKPVSVSSPFVYSSSLLISGIGVAVGSGVGVGVDVAVGSGVGVDVAVGATVGVGVDVAVASGVGADVAVGPFVGGTLPSSPLHPFSSKHNVLTITAISNHLFFIL